MYVFNMFVQMLSFWFNGVYIILYTLIFRASHLLHMSHEGALLFVMFDSVFLLAMSVWKCFSVLVNN